MAMPWLEKENLEKWLKTYVKNIESEENSAKGENYLSTLRKLTVTAEDGRIFSLVVKCRKLNGTTGEVYENTNIFKKEIELYGNTIHNIHDILNKAFPEGIEPLAPECYYACDDYLVLEDLSCYGFKMHNQRVGLDLDHRFALTLVDEIETWDEEWHKYIPKLKKLAEDPMPRILESTRRYASDFNVLIHGDFWTNNILFREETGSIRVIDFQTMTYASAVMDFIYFLCTSPMVDEYHTSLTQALKAMCYNKHIPTLEDLKREIHEKAFYGIYVLVAPYPLMQCGSHSDFSFDEIMATRKTPGPKMFDDTYRQNIKTLLPFFADKDNNVTKMVKPWENKENIEKWLKTPVKDIVSRDNYVNGNLSKMLKLTVTTQDGRFVPLLVKYKILNGTTGDVYGKTDIFRKEVEIYENTIHRIHNILKEVYPGLTTTLIEEVESWGREWEEMIPWLKHLSKNFMPILKDLSLRKDSEFNVLNHGDVWTNNMLFRGGSAGIRFVDFQLAAYTSPILDITYFLNTSPNEYYDTLTHILKTLGYKKEIPTFTDIEYQVKHSLYGLFAIIAPYTVMQSDPELGFSFEECITTGKNPGRKMYGENIKKHIKFMLPLFYKNSRLK
ncbi:hypothetical protein C0J52_09364 [Blattella germanica]|nr:hypothetical protein C0J52_09364 [Blattella germanica]